MGRRLVNGVEGGAIAADDRGLQYGDGLFETMAVRDGRIRAFALHMARLETGCTQLGIPMPAVALIDAECCQVREGLGTGVVKLVVTRGPGPRGYRPPGEPAVTRIVIASALRVEAAADDIVIRVCETRLGTNPQLAGIKHLNRLEQVLASAEWNDEGVAEGLMLAADNRVIGATAANLFFVRDGRLHTPEIRDCGVAGVMRQQVLAAARSLGVAAVVDDFRLSDLRDADEVFLTNAVTGIRAVIELQGHAAWPHGELTRALSARLDAEEPPAP